MKAWNEMTAIEQLRAQYSDLHKDVYGMRPTAEHYIAVTALPDDEFVSEYNALVDMLD
jgi:hypothetical protein